MAEGPPQEDGIDHVVCLVARETNVFASQRADAAALERPAGDGIRPFAVDRPWPRLEDGLAVHFEPCRNFIEDCDLFAVDGAVRLAGDVENKRAVLADVDTASSGPATIRRPRSGQAAAKELISRSTPFRGINLPKKRMTGSSSGIAHSLRKAPLGGRVANSSRSRPLYLNAIFSGGQPSSSSSCFSCCEVAMMCLAFRNSIRPKSTCHIRFMAKFRSIGLVIPKGSTR